MYPLNHVAYSKSEIWESGHLFTNDNGTYCMRAPRSIDTTIEARKRANGAGEPCKFVIFIDPAHLIMGVEVTDYSKCGFNQNSSGYCDIRKGDYQYSNALMYYSSLFRSTDNWHLMSDLSNCVELTTKDVEVLTNWNRAQFYVGKGNYASIADNDACVKSEITQAYWGVDSSIIGFSLNSSLLTIFGFLIVAMI